MKQCIVVTFVCVSSNNKYCHVYELPDSVKNAIIQKIMYNQRMSCDIISFIQQIDIS